MRDAGALFRRYVYGTKKMKTAEEVEQLIVHTILRAPRNSVVVIHWHYAVRRPDGYIPQIDYSRLAQIAQSKKISEVCLLHIDAPFNAIIARRALDRYAKMRALDPEVIRDEQKHEDEFLLHMYEVFRAHLNERVRIVRLYNRALCEATQYLAKFFETLLPRA